MSARQFGPVGVRARRDLRVLMSPQDVARFWSKYDVNGPVVRPEFGPCWIWTRGKDKDDYGKFHIWVDGREVHLRAHRVALELTIGPFDGLALHRCDVFPCGNPAHLFPGSDADNARDREAKGRHPHLATFHPVGELHPMAKATEALVVEIRRRAASGEPQIAIARALGLGRSLVNMIVLGKRWRHVVVPTMEVT